MRPSCFAALLLLSTACVEDRALARRDEVQRYRAEHPQGAPGPGGFGAWRWGMTPTEVVLSTANAWQAGRVVQAPVTLGDAQGLATFSFRDEQLTAVEVLVPNRDGAEQQLTALISRELGTGDSSCPQCDAEKARVAAGVGAAILGTLLVALEIAGAAAGRTTAIAPRSQAWYPWYSSAREEPGPRTIAWKTATTHATLTVDATAVKIEARSIGALPVAATAQPPL